MYVYIQSEPGLWTVGFYKPNGKWEPESDHTSRAEAAQRVRWLNGGAGMTEEQFEAEKDRRDRANPRKTARDAAEIERFLTEG